MKRAYETIFIVSPDLEEQATKEVVAKVKELIEKSAVLESIDEWGKRKLAYPINHKQDGYYVLVNFSAEPTFIEELERVYKITGDIIKFITVKKEQ